MANPNSPDVYRRPALVEIGTLLHKPTPIGENNKGINAIYYGSLTLDNGIEQTAYIKHIPPDEVFTEAICSLICCAMGIPTPTPYLVLLDSPSLIPGLRTGEDPVLFATADANRPTFRAWLKQSEFVIDYLVKWAHSPGSAVLDEQIGNQDRHPGNILMDAGGDCRLIDHGLAFDRRLHPSQIQRYNTFADIVSRRPGTTPSTTPLGKISKALPKLAGIKFDELLDYSRGTQYASQAHIDHIRDFYQTRLNHIRDIFDLRFGTTNHPSLPL